MCWFGKKKPKKNLKEDALTIKVSIHRVVNMVDARRIDYDAKIVSMERDLEKSKKEISDKMNSGASKSQLTTLLDNYDMMEKKLKMAKAMRDPFLNLSNVFFEIDFMAEQCCNLGLYSAIVKTFDKDTRKKFENLLSGADDISDRIVINATTELVRKKMSEFMIDIRNENEHAAENMDILLADAKSERSNGFSNSNDDADNVDDRLAKLFGNKEEAPAENEFVKPITANFDNNNDNNANNSRKANNN